MAVPCELIWHSKPFDQLSTIELFNILKLRQQVFVIEQTCIYPDIDDIDRESIHYFGVVNTQIAGYLRMIPPGVSSAYASIGRVVVAPEFRGSGLGRVLMQTSLTEMQTQFPDHAIKIGAQHHLEAFYQSLGFETCSEMYLEDGIPHIDMLRHA